VEVVTVLDPQDKFAFDGMVTQLRADDPRFVRRIEKIGRPRHRLRVTLGILLWTIAPICIVYGGWTGLIMAVVAVGYGARLMIKRTGLTGDAEGFSWWSSSGRRPGASL